MQPVGLVPWIVLGFLLAALAPKVRTEVVGWLLVLTGIAVFAVRLHHEGPYPFPGALDFAAACAALLVGALLIRPPWSGPSQRGTSRLMRVLLGVSPIVFLLALVAYGHEAEEVVVLRTHGPQGSLRETRLWIVDYDGSPWIVTGRGSGHDRDLTENPRAEIVRRGEARCWMAERHLDRPTLEAVLEVRSEKYLAQRVALATGTWKHFSDREDLDEIAVALRFLPCPGPHTSSKPSRAQGRATVHAAPRSSRRGHGFASSRAPGVHRRLCSSRCRRHA
jgi:hypothetical protein